MRECAWCDRPRSDLDPSDMCLECHGKVIRYTLYALVLSIPVILAIAWFASQ